MSSRGSDVSSRGGAPSGINPLVAGYGSAGGSTTTTAPTFNPSMLGVLQQLDAAQANYPALGVPGYAGLSAQDSTNIAGLLNPTNFTDQQRQGAEAAVGGGFSGSQFGDINTLNLTETEKLRRQAMGSQLLSAATARLPAPVNPAALLGKTGGDAVHVPTGPGGLTYTNIPGAPGSRGGAPGAPTSLQPGGPPPPMVAPGTSAPSNPFMSLVSPPADPMAAWRASVGLGPPTPGANPYTGQQDWNTEGGVAVDQWGEPVDYSPIYAGESGGDYGGEYADDEG